MSFGKKLLSLRKERGLSQDELGGQLKVSRQTVSKKVYMILFFY